MAWSAVGNIKGPTGANGSDANVTGHEAATDPHPQYLTAAEGNAAYVGTGDSRLSDSRTPTAHNHAASDVNSGTLAIARIPTGTTSTTVPLGNDSRFTDARTPTAHTHAASDVNSGTLAAARLPLVTSTPTTVTYSASIAIDPTVGNNFKITATGALALSVSTTGATDGQMVMVEVLASGAARTVTVSGTLTTGLVAATAVASTKTGFFGFRYSALVGGWVVLAVTATQ